jgi:aminodeoxyfutalosine synthase
MKSWASDMATCGVNEDWLVRLDQLLPPTEFFDSELREIVDAIRSGRHLTQEQGITLWNYPNLSVVASLAAACKQARFDDNVFFNSNLHVNQTNICTLACKFCAFRRGPKAKDAYALSIDEFIERIRPYGEIIDEVHTVGGLHPEWDVTYYESLFSAVKKAYPDIHIKSLSAVEIKHIAEVSGISPRSLLSRLNKSGLDSLPGGGAEILDDEVRNVICNGKESSDEYIAIHRDAHSIGMPTNCTMLFGTIETVEQRIAHLCKLRAQQDETGGFQCFVPYPYLPDNSRLPEAQLASGSEVLRMIAISRLMLDNIPHIKAYRMNIGDRMSELALHHGADDFDGTVGHEEIMHEAGSDSIVGYSKSELTKFILEAKGIPVLRNSNYTNFRRFDDDDRDASIQLPMQTLVGE